MTDLYETEADVLFREDAARQGYLKGDEHEPGDGRGLWAYYRDNGMQPPKYLGSDLPLVETPMIEALDVAVTEMRV